MDLTPGQLAGAKMRFNLHSNRGRGKVLAQGHWADHYAVSLFQHRVEKGMTHLRPGSYSTKLGGVVAKGRWRGMPIYALTLQERATCPRDCPLWLGCYGNNMPWAKRSPHGLKFELELWRELHRLNREHRRGFVVRLHVLGDFYSESYVDFWEAALDHFENLNVFGYTARESSTPIGAAIQRLRISRWHRFSVRTSGAQKGVRSVVIDSVRDKPAGAIICPAQTGATKSCATCGLCWHTKKPIAFLRH